MPVEDKHYICPICLSLNNRRQRLAWKMDHDAYYCSCGFEVNGQDLARGELFHAGVRYAARFGGHSNRSRVNDKRANVIFHQLSILKDLVTLKSSEMDENFDQKVEEILEALFEQFERIDFDFDPIMILHLLGSMKSWKTEAEQVRSRFGLGGIVNSTVDLFITPEPEPEEDEEPDDEPDEKSPSWVHEILEKPASKFVVAKPETVESKADEELVAYIIKEFHGPISNSKPVLVPIQEPNPYVSEKEVVIKPLMNYAEAEKFMKEFLGSPAIGEAVETTYGLHSFFSKMKKGQEEHDKNVPPHTTNPGNPTG